jgi:hypothetical protein
MDGIDYNLAPDIIATEGTLVAIQRKVVEYLRAVPELASVEQIFIEDQLDLAAEIDKALSSGLLSICVSIGKAVDSAPSAPGILALDPCEIVIRCIENPTINRAAGGTGLTRNRAGELIAKALKLQRINNGCLGRVRLENSSLPKDADVIGRDVTFILTAAI